MTMYEFIMVECSIGTFILGAIRLYIESKKNNKQ